MISVTFLSTTQFILGIILTEIKLTLLDLFVKNNENIFYIHYSLLALVLNTIYKKIKADDEKWIVSQECAEKLKFFGKEITIEGDIAGTEIIGKSATTLHNNQEIPILEAEFVEPAIGTGLVMSVPAHAPKDYQALMDLKAKNHELASKIEPIPIISTEGYGEIPAKEICEKMGVSDQSDQKLEEATNELYLKEFTDGKLNDKCGNFQKMLNFKNISEGKWYFKKR